MKRIGNIYHKIYDLNNLRLADKKARKGKKHQKGIQKFDEDRENNLLKLHYMLRFKTFKNSKYHNFKIVEEKERDISSLPYYPDRIVHHAILNVLEPIFTSMLTADTYSCVKRRGPHKALYKVRQYLRDVQNTTFCLKLDLRKFYPSIKNEILKRLLRRKFKDKNLLWLMDEIIDSALGIPLGNFTSQHFANYYLMRFDHYIKECVGVRYYLRYSDDLVILHGDKVYLHKLRVTLQDYLEQNLRLQVKSNWQVFPVAARGIDFVGYRIFHTHCLVRKRIKRRFAKMFMRRPNRASMASYKGWLDHCNSKHLQKKLLHEKT